MKILRTAFTLFIFLGFAATTHAQFNVNVAYEREYNSNPFRSVNPASSWISVYDIGVSYLFENTAVGYFGLYDKFTNIQDRDFYWHQIAYWGAKDGASYGAMVEQRMNVSGYNTYNYNTGTAYLNYRYRNDTMSWLFSGSGNVSLYPSLDNFDNFKLSAGLQANKSLPSRTTLIGSIGLNYKRYFTEFQDTVTVTTGGMGPGGTSEMVNSTSPAITQVNWKARIAQSLTNTTGLAVQYQHRYLFDNTDRSLAELAYTATMETEIFDDPLSYEGFSIGGELTQLMPFGFTLKAAYYHYNKHYTSQPVYIDADTYTEERNREDRYNTSWLYLERDFGFGLFQGNYMTLTLLYQLKNNS
ncbi:MAG: hypothetical protein GF372_05595, partial [Candidatus Marinimicrobia bacterium]|nr:hypothetical protein [Candidatus Neomarinimicrobiota bacterium]